VFSTRTTTAQAKLFVYLEPVSRITKRCTTLFVDRNNQTNTIKNMKALLIAAALVICLVSVQANYGFGNQRCRQLRNKCDRCNNRNRARGACNAVCNRADRVCDRDDILVGSSTTSSTTASTTSSTTTETTTSPYTSTTSAYTSTTSYYPDYYSSSSTTTDSSGLGGYFGNRRPIHRGRRPHGRRPDGRVVVQPVERENNNNRDSGCSGLFGCLLNGGSGSNSGSGILGGSGGLGGLSELLGGGSTTNTNKNNNNNGGSILRNLGGGGGGPLGINLGGGNNGGLFGGGLSNLIGK